MDCGRRVNIFPNVEQTIVITYTLLSRLGGSERRLGHPESAAHRISVEKFPFRQQRQMRFFARSSTQSTSSRRRSGPFSDNEGMARTITRDPDTMHGVPVFRGTRVPVQTLFDYLEGGDTIAEFLAGFPTVPRELALDALEEARILLLTNYRCGY